MAPLADGAYLVTSAKNSSLYLEIQPDNVIKVGKKRDIIAQRWNLSASDPYNHNSTYRFESQLTESFVGVRREGEKSFVAGGYPRVHWQLSPRGHSYTIGLPNDDRIVALGENGLVIFTERTGEMDQRWNLTPFVDVDDQKQPETKPDITERDKYRELVKSICAAGYWWTKESGGYRCGGGNHFVSNEQLGY